MKRGHRQGTEAPTNTLVSEAGRKYSKQRGWTSGETRGQNSSAGRLHIPSPWERRAIRYIVFSCWMWGALWPSLSNTIVTHQVICPRGAHSQPPQCCSCPQGAGAEQGGAKNGFQNIPSALSESQPTRFPLLPSPNGLQKLLCHLLLNVSCSEIFEIPAKWKSL